MNNDTALMKGVPGLSSSSSSSSEFQIESSDDIDNSSALP